MINFDKLIDKFAATKVRKNILKCNFGNNCKLNRSSAMFNMFDTYGYLMIKGLVFKKFLFNLEVPKTFCSHATGHDKITV